MTIGSDRVILHMPAGDARAVHAMPSVVQVPDDMLPKLEH